MSSPLEVSSVGINVDVPDLSPVFLVIDLVILIVGSASNSDSAIHLLLPSAAGAVKCRSRWCLPLHP